MSAPATPASSVVSVQELTCLDTAVLAREVQRLLATQHEELFFDFENVEVLPSPVLATIAILDRRLSQGGYRIETQNVSPTVKSCLETMGIGNRARVA